MTKQEFLDALQTARAEWDAALMRMDASQMEQAGVEGNWSVKDLIAHVTWFEREMVDLLRERALVGSELWALPADERNAAIYELNRHRPLAEVVEEARRVYAELLVASQTLTAQELNDPQSFRDMPPDWIPWKVLAENSYEHYRAHLAKLAAFSDHRIEFDGKT